MSAKTQKNMPEGTVETAAPEETVLRESVGEPVDSPVIETEDRKETQAERDEAFFNRLPDPCVYCGPSVRGVAQQYTVYNGGVPDVMKQFVSEHPAAKGLLVSVNRFVKVRTKLETRGTAESILFNKLREELQ